MRRNIFGPGGPIPSRYRELRRWRLINGRRRVGVMGGTFDPIHHGHLVAGSEVAHHFGLDEVVFVPTGEPYQKDDRKVSPAEDRYLMTVIATASNPRFSVSRVDIDRPGPTYTIDTLRDLKDANGPHTDLYFITGADALANILTWHDVDALFSLAHFIGCTRAGPRGGAPGVGDREQRVPSRGRRGRAGLVSGAGRRGPVHREAWTLRQV